MGDGKKEEEGKEVITAVYKLHLHCRQCAEDIKKPLSRAKGVEKVDADANKGKVSVKGRIDSKSILKLLEKKSKRKVELVEEKKEGKKEEKKVVKKSNAEEEIKTTVLKVDLHCQECANDLKRALGEIKGVIKIKTDWQKQMCTVEGKAKPEELIKCARRKLNKHAEIVPPKEKKKEGKKGMEEKQEQQKKKEEEKKEIEKFGSSSSEKVKVLVPYIIYYPQTAQISHNDMVFAFSDENPNACTVM